jgi:hypothetical protein
MATKKLRKGLKAILTFDDPAQITIKSPEGEKPAYEYRVYILEEGQKIVWGPDNKYYSTGPGLLEVEFSFGGRKTLEGYLDCQLIWNHVQRLMMEGWKVLRQE